MSEQDQEELFHANYALAASCVVKRFGALDEDMHQEGQDGWNLDIVSRNIACCN